MAKRQMSNPQDDLERAQDLVYSAWETDKPARRAEIARKALAISPLCADAYVILAHQAEKGSDDALALWKQGVEAGEAALGERAFEDDAGLFWGILETRPYMRARTGLAYARWHRGDCTAAVSHLEAMLELNPNDNQGLRYPLASWLLELGEDAKLAALFKRYKDDESADFLWTAALAEFRRSGDGPASQKRLRKARKDNRHVVAYLAGAKAMPKKLPPFISPGDEDEAVAYADGARKTWAAIPGALDWLTRQGVSEPSGKRNRGRKGPV